MSIQVFEHRALQPGPALLVFGAIHGDEVCGPRALLRLHDELRTGSLELQKGRVTMVPICNPLAHARKIRLVEQNLNRVFMPHAHPFSYEHRLANALAPLMQHCDYFVDLHSMTARGEPFVFLNRVNALSEKLCRALGPRKVMMGWPELYGANSDPELSNCTQMYADSLGKPNALIECGTHGEPEADEVAYRATRGAMAMLGLSDPLSELVESEDREFLKLVEVVFRKFPEDRLVKEWATFDTVSSGELIAYQGPEARELRSPVDGMIVFPHPGTPIGAELYYIATRKLSGSA